MNLNEGLAATIRVIMKQKRMNLTEFSEELGISRAALHDYIRARGNPSAATIEHIARCLGVSTAALFASTEEQREIILLLPVRQHGGAAGDHPPAPGHDPGGGGAAGGEAAANGGPLPGDGEAMERVADALRFRQPMPVRELIRYRSGGTFPVCPQCRSSMEREYQNYCDRYGQHLSWKQLRRARVVNR